MTRQTIKTECVSCRGTGTYGGFAEPEDAKTLKREIKECQEKYGNTP